ncbi:hypothetical protein BABINDRAFT_158866 [Babjeviella inositovora NRRL Y-12698]|uniref:Ribosomal protein L27/L41, mitochondrial n=1 Tax=Babjeviella inositovora NRRL Y-12698 TaxID=984486 RepID=A0A1E3QX39_9ASCO|nr:uncharacterized protein BABINDRAFT_158866 [Babjeviella inositovora NRRL Y-12698]ODQ82226.1 hypothetical protein BABINDRAFT_158866 [Babjeviella inositovora NRRL Y-12698]
MKNRLYLSSYTSGSTFATTQHAMRASQVLQFQKSLVSQLTRPWKKFRDGTLFYGQHKTGSKRHQLTTKQGNKNYYKGTRSSGVGIHTRKGAYQIVWSKVRTFVVPQNLSACTLKPLVSMNTPQIKHHFQGYPKGMIDSKLNFDKIKEFIEHGEVESKLVDNKYIERG